MLLLIAVNQLLEDEEAETTPWRSVDVPKLAELTLPGQSARDAAAFAPAVLEFELDPKLLLVSQPTRGVDIGAIEFIHRKLIELRDKGRAVLLVSAELEEVTALADRLLVIREGEIVGEVNPKTATFEEIGLLMTGG